MNIENHWNIKGQLKEQLKIIENSNDSRTLKDIKDLYNSKSLKINNSQYEH